ncbi:MAG: PAS domain S-box protein [Candidatus Rokubacteria bacterium]|nr:PAS domain S-box protein [Candidatus Rokubacteria bacterium]
MGAAKRTGAGHELAEATARALLEAASEGIVIVNSAGRVVGVNRKTEEMFGYGREKLIGQPVETLLPERFRSGHVAHRLSYFSEPRVRPMGRGFDLSGRRKDGSEFPVEVSLSYAKSEEGLVAMAFITDITQRKQAERRLQAQFAVTEALAGSATLADAIPGILRALCECLGWELGELWSLDLESGVLRWTGSWYTPGLDASGFESLSRDMTFAPGAGLPGLILVTGQPLWIADLTSTIPADVCFVRMGGALEIGLRAAVGFPILIGHRVTGVIVFFNRTMRQPDEDLLKMMADIGSRIGQYIEHRRVQGELERQREALSQSEKLAAIGTLSAGLTHEINNPLGIITARIDVMMEEAEAYRLPEELKEDLAVLRRNAQRVARIAQGLLSFARQTPGERVALNLNQVVEETLLLVDKQATKEGITVVRDLAADLPPMLGNANQLQQVLLNLINNAREVMGRGGILTVATEIVAGPPRGVRCRVSDTGRGIPPEHLPKLFDPFFTTKPGGTGLGLSVTYGIVKDHEGVLEVQSELGKGSHFMMAFPALAGTREGT